MTTSISLPPSSALGYLDKAVAALGKLGINFRSNETNGIAPMLADISAINEADTLAIGRTLEHASSFNEAAREQVSAMDYSTRYTKIVRAFDTIVEDAREMQKQLEDGHIGFSEKMRNLGMRLTRGSIHSRFIKIRESFQDVTTSTRDQLDREAVVMNAYLDFRLALKEAAILAAKMLKQQEAHVAAAKQALTAKNAAVSAA